MRVEDFIHIENRQKKLRLLLENRTEELSSTFETLENWAAPLAEKISPLVCDTPGLLHNAIEQKESILFEGAQGTFLDIDHGSYPYVTSSNTVAGAACTGAGVGPTHIDAVVGIAKAYLTRVGAGPFRTEISGEASEKLRQIGGEFGATTGRPRRCGWLDIPQLKRSCALNGVTHLCMMKLDILSYLNEVPLCIAYQNDEPVYETLPGWNVDISDVRSWEGLPVNCQKYIERVEELIKTPIALVSVGPDRSANIFRHALFENL